MQRFSAAVAIALGISVGASVLDAAKTLDLYFIDVEGGQATLIVTPAGESMLVDAGFAADGTFESMPGDPAKARDANRILAAARDAGVTRIDYFLSTHFHADHLGGVVELASLLPIRTFIDHGSPLPEAENVAGTLRTFEGYAKVRATGKHIEPGPGDRLPLKGVEAVVVSAKGATLRKPLKGAGDANTFCAATAPPAQEKNENPRSTGFHLRFGKFSFLDIGDLTGEPLHALVCPRDLIGPVSVYLVAHHGGPDVASPETFNALSPMVSIVNNGPRKGGAAATLALGKRSTWQLHKSVDAGSENADDDQIANLDETTAHWIKVSANRDGSFVVTNGRTGRAVHHGARGRTATVY